VPFESSDMGDAIGELANVIAGSVKARLDQRGAKANISLPTVLRGSAVESVHLQNVRAMRQEVRTTRDDHTERGKRREPGTGNGEQGGGNPPQRTGGQARERETGNRTAETSPRHAAG